MGSPTDDPSISPSTSSTTSLSSTDPSIDPSINPTPDPTSNPSIISTDAIISTTSSINQCTDDLILLSFGYIQNNDDLSEQEVNDIIAFITNTFIETEIVKRADNCTLDNYDQTAFINNAQNEAIVNISVCFDCKGNEQILSADNIAMELKKDFVILFQNKTKLLSILDNSTNIGVNIRNVEGAVSESTTTINQIAEIEANTANTVQYDMCIAIASVFIIVLLIMTVALIIYLKTKTKSKEMITSSNSNVALYSETTTVHSENNLIQNEESHSEDLYIQSNDTQQMTQDETKNDMVDDDDLYVNDKVNTTVTTGGMEETSNETI